MLRVLQVVGGLARGGTESVVMNFYRQIDRSQVQFDFVSHHPELNDYEQEIRDLGGRVFRVPEFTGLNLLPYLAAWKALLRAHPECRVIHAHAWSTAPIYLRAAKRRGLYTIAHSHSVSARSGLSAAGRLLLKRLLPVRPDYYMACSGAAAEWLFGADVTRRENFSILPNAIDAERYRFDPARRESVRAQYGVRDRLVIGHVGSFDSNKNQGFAVDLLARVRAERPEAVLWLIGSGPDREPVREKALAMGLEEAVFFWGVRDDVADLLQAMDVFVLPSHFESFGNAALEAQCAGLPVICSDTIPREVAVNDDIAFLPLDRPELWAERIGTSAGRRERSDAPAWTRYDILTAAEWLQRFYLSRPVTGKR